MIRLLICLALFPLGACGALGSPPERLLAHDVFITLQDDSVEACEALAQDCRDSLSDIPSVLELDAGVRAPSQTREVNDIEYDVVLHVTFADVEGLEAYIVHPDHEAFVERMLPNVAAVRVFDSWVR